MAHTKTALRAEARRARAAARAAGDPVRAADAVAALLLEHLAPHAGQVVAGYAPAGAEMDALTALEALAARGIATALPVIVPGARALRFAPWAPGDALAPGPYTVLQPTGAGAVRPDIVLVPLLAFDRRGGRLGQGGGHYDATLAALRADGAPVAAVGLAWAEQACLFPLPAEPHDQALDWVITPAGAHRFCGHGRS
jgi:5-formyltetrahydrofolate cyclo-ligase